MSTAEVSLDIMVQAAPVIDVAVAGVQGPPGTESVLSQAWAEGTLPGGPGTKSAKEYADVARAWAQTIGQVVDFSLAGEAIVTGVAYPFGRTGPAAQTFGYLYLAVKAGTGSVTATIFAGATPVIEDIVFNAGTPAAAIDIDVPAETDIWITFTAIAGAPTLITGRMQGA